MALRRRMFSPDIFIADDLCPGVRRLLLLGLIALAEDSGCLVWGSPAMFKATILPYEDLTVEDVAEHLSALVECGRVQLYVIDGRQYAFLPDFPGWQRSMTRWQGPQMVPLPTWIRYTPGVSKHSAGSGRYEWTRGSGVFVDCARAENVGSQDLTETNERNESKEPVEQAVIQPVVQPDEQAVVSCGACSENAVFVSRSVYRWSGEVVEPQDLSVILEGVARSRVEAAVERLLTLSPSEAGSAIPRLSQFLNDATDGAA